MKSNALSILFVIQKAKQNKQGKCPIICRITYSKKRKVFSTGLFIEPQLWDSKSQLAKFFSESDFINDSLTIILQKLRTSYLKLKVKGESFSVSDVVLDYNGKTIQKESISRSNC